ncbi:NYN domain-containing protein [Bradyrhizobium sp. WYCCWR 13023]|uniref:NYN domain-containing protein n=1 Tax=Bradyrhizobium zhengyangense TaxID=2911009 RepID=A0A9X1RC30_9BRAD|nr:NYN domain-containing protein [Bradyrhizobium zhengyangense]MCG2628850.1 NYN domain-containing protein [Bradyrhizobium zhengyangense]
MKRSAVFVDAGYLFAQGSVALTGSKKARSLLELKEEVVIDALTKLSYQRSDGSELLRIYWYDGANYRGPTIEQDRIAHLDNVKLRLGFLNSAGEQKGVDSLIVTDIIELARLGAIGDAVLLSGDEDVRVGVQIAQNYGVRIHLLGIEPARASQSKALLQEADTTGVWDKALVSTFLSERPAVTTTATLGPASAPIEIPTTSGDSSTIIAVATAMVDTLEGHQLKGIHVYWETERGVPPEFDGKLLARCRDELGRDLIHREKRDARNAFSSAVRAKGAP